MKTGIHPSPTPSPPRRFGPAVAVAVAAALVLVAAACGSSSKTSSSTSTTAGSATTATTAPRGSGPVDVLYAGSLVDAMTKQVGPAFNTATGYTFTGTSGDSGALATMIKGGTTKADVFISASPMVDTELEGSTGGNHLSWYAPFATSPLVLGYNPKSTFAAALKTEPWYKVLAEPGILVGRTDPATDPKGKLTVEALTAAATQHDEPALTKLSTATSTVFPENTLVARLQAGQIDVGFFYAAEANAAGIATVPLTGTSLKATYTVSVLNDAPDQAAAVAFVKYLLGPATTGPLNADGFDVIKPLTVTGSGVPAGLEGVLSGQ